MSAPLPRRVVVTSSRARAARRPAPGGRSGIAGEIDAQSALGEVYMRSLVRHQLRLALVACTLLAAGLGGLPLLLLAVPELADVAVAGVPLPWLVLGAGVYPVLVALAWWYTRAAERSERDFADLVERS